MAINTNENVRILLGEKNSEIRRGVAAVLRTYGYRDITEANDFNKVLEVISNDEVDLLVCDASLDGEDVPDLVSRIRHQEFGKNPFLATILLTSDLSPENVRKISNCGTDAILTKPISPAALADRIETLTWNRKGFVVTTDYTGPDRRRADRIDAEKIPVISVPNSLKYIAEGNKNMAALQNDIAASTKRINGQKMERHAFQIDYLIKQIMDHFANGEFGDDVVTLVERLRKKTRNLVDRMARTDKAHVRELGNSLLSVAFSISEALPYPLSKDRKLLPELGRAIKQSFVADDRDIKIAQDISKTLIRKTG